jgi:hypothetical protein
MRPLGILQQLHHGAALVLARVGANASWAPLPRWDLALHHGQASQGRHILTMAPFVFTCPATSMKVQHWLDDDEDAP